MAGDKVNLAMENQERSGTLELPPMENPLILELVFGYCSFSGLKVVRQVSRLWRHCSQKKWKKTVKLRIGPIPYTVADFSAEGRRRERLHEQFMRLVASNASKAKVSPSFWDSIKTLELDDVTVPTLGSLRNALFHCLPGLEHLILRKIVVSGGKKAPQDFEGVEPQNEQRNLKAVTVRLSSQPQLTISWMELLSHFPSLETIDLDVSSESAEAIFIAIDAIRREDPSKLNLKQFSVPDDYSFHTGDVLSLLLSTLMDGSLHLEALSLGKIRSQLTANAFPEILRVHGPTLKKLRFLKEWRLAFPPDAFPPLEKLEELEVKMCCSLGALAFLSLTPNLRRLTIHQGDWRDGFCPGAHLPGFPVVLDTCKELQILKSSIQQYPYSLEILKTLTEWIPNLTVLKIEWVDNARFTLICEHWTNLLELHVRKSQVDTSGILGWDEEDVKWWKQTGALSRPVTVPRPNITALKNLQILFLSAKSMDPRPEPLSSAAGFFGIEELPDLRRLRLKSYQFEENEYWKELHEKYPHSSW